MKRGHIVEIDITRAIAILGVLIVHATSFPVSQLNPSSSLYGLYNFFNIFTQFATPTFIFLSSFVLFYSYFNKPVSKNLVTNFYKKRFLYIVIPYIIFSIIYYMYSYPVYSYYMTSQEMLVDFLQKLSRGETAAHLYFIFISIQFYIIFPLLLTIIQKYPRLVKHVVWIGFLIEWGFVLLNHFVLNLPNKASISLSYFAYYGLGMYAGVNYERIVGFLRIKKSELFRTKFGLFSIFIWISWFISTIAYIVLWYMIRTAGFITDWFVYELLWNAYTFLSAIILTQISYYIFQRLPAKIVNLILHIGGMSFGIYLIHLLILNVYQRVIPNFGSPMLYHIKSMGGFVVTLLISWILVTLIKKYVRQSWILFGKDTPIQHKR